MMWNRDRKRKKERCTTRKNMMRKRESKRKNCTRRSEIMWKRDSKTNIKVNRVGRENMRQKSTRKKHP